MKKEIYDNKEIFSQMCEPLDCDIRENNVFKFYRLKETGQIICDFNLKLDLGGEKVEIAQITDVHLNYCLSDDQEDSEVLLTKQCRKWLADGESVVSLKKAMDVADFSDQTVITGDILDYLSAGAAMLVKKHIFERDPEIICAIGGHDITKQMETNLPDKLSTEERLRILENFWINDIHYFSKVIKDKIIVIALNNGMGRYYTPQLENFKKDINRARKENKFILLFQHEPISTGNPEDTAVSPILSVDGANSHQRDFYNGCIGNPKTTDNVTKEMYRLITESADVVKGVFCGHYHSAFYTEINTASCNKKDKYYIPQVVAMANPYFGHAGSVMRIVIE